jgi:hypothetical protein
LTNLRKSGVPDFEFKYAPDPDSVQFCIQLSALKGGERRHNFDASGSQVGQRRNGGSHSEAASPGTTSATILGYSKFVGDVGNQESDAEELDVGE